MEQVVLFSSTPSANRSETPAPGLLKDRQHTLAEPLVQSGVGLHLGESVQVRILPAQLGDGRYFVRVDLPSQPVISAHIDRVRETRLSTELAVETADGIASVRTVEHLLAALTGMGIDNARIEIDGPEVPLLDGSAQDWARAIATAGISPQSAPHTLIPLAEPVWVRHEDAFVAAIPAPELRFSYGIDFDLPAIGNQWVSWSPSAEPFETAIAPARTFGLAHQIDQLRSLGLIRGGSLDNALVCGPDGWLNPPLRFSNEPVRHKLLDLVGDISLLGWMPLAHLIAYKASHQLHTELARRLRRLLSTP